MKVIVIVCILSISGAYNTEILQEELLAWLGSGTNKTLIVSRPFLEPPVFTTDEVLYQSGVERDRFYERLGIWKQTRCIEYKIKDARWTDVSLPQMYMGTFEVIALLPEKDIEGHLPQNTKILLKGKTIEKKDVPLIYEVTKGENRIINITFSLKSNFELEKYISWTILNYIKNKDKEIIPGIPCSGRTGHSIYWRSKIWQSSTDVENTPVKHNYDEGRAQGPGSLSQVIFSSPFIKNGKPSFMGINLFTEPVDPVRFFLLSSTYEADLISQKSMFMFSADKSTLCSNYASVINWIVIASTSTATQWILETLDGLDYSHTDIFRLFTDSKTEFSFIRPDFWVEEEKIHVFKINGNTLKPVPIKIDKNILIIDTEQGNYIIYYGILMENNLTKFWAKFLAGLKEKKIIPGENITNYKNYINDWKDFSINWIEW